MKRLTFGRGSDCDIVLNDKRVTRHHGHLSVYDDEVYITDDGSKNGTFVNGRLIRGKTLIEHDDEVLLANTVFLDWERYVDALDSDTVSRWSDPLPERPLIDIPSKIELNQNHAEVYRNGESGADWKVPFRRNMGNRIGNAVGSTLGCLLSALIVAAVIGLLVLMLQ